MAELWKIRARKATAVGGVGAGAVRGWDYEGQEINRNDISVMITVGDHRLIMLQAEWDRVMEQATSMIKEMENA